MIWSKVVLWKPVVQTETRTDILLRKMLVSAESHIQAAPYHHFYKTYLNGFYFTERQASSSCLSN